MSSPIFCQSRLYARALAGTPVCPKLRIFAHSIPRLKKQHELRGVSWKDCVCDGPHGQPEEEHDINEGRSVGSAKGTISCYLQDCPLMFRTHAAAYVHGQEEHGFLPVRVYEVSR